MKKMRSKKEGMKESRKEGKQERNEEGGRKKTTMMLTKDEI